MARRKKKKSLNKLGLSRVPYQRPEVVGMYSIKTIRLHNGAVLIEQGQRIEREVVSKAEEQHAMDELVANAMPGGK